MKKRITLITWYKSPNYGTCLQAYALYSTLEHLGYNTMICNGVKKYSLKDKIILLIKKIVPTEILKWYYSTLKSNKGFSYIKQKKIDSFVKQYQELKPKSEQDLDDIVFNTDVFITGSDQIWNTLHGYDPFMFLNFAKEKKRIAFASSIGTSDFNEIHKPIIKPLLDKFSHIGVREESAKLAISNLLQRNDIQQVIDPTFLLSTDDWHSIAQNSEVEIALPQKYILCYLIGNNADYKKQLERVSAITKVEKIIIIPAAENPNIQTSNSIVYTNAGPVDFIYLIEKASLVCTDSFHATALSINLKKDFVNFLRFKENEKNSQNSRIHDLLNRYGLNNRLYSIDTDEWKNHIDYNGVNKLLAKDIKEGLLFLSNAIEN